MSSTLPTKAFLRLKYIKKSGLGNIAVYFHQISCLERKFPSYAKTQ